ncbi:MAG: hypothetical protein LBC53_10850 [Spirochaetaceae bacterium]|nr:hypothetical protein [Spirochaetaceae bacterium]
MFAKSVLSADAAMLFLKQKYGKSNALKISKEVKMIASSIFLIFVKLRL